MIPIHVTLGTRRRSGDNNTNRHRNDARWRNKINGPSPERGGTEKCERSGPTAGGRSLAEPTTGSPSVVASMPAPRAASLSHVS
jgi:hypothetical protein